MDWSPLEIVGDPELVGDDPSTGDVVLNISLDREPESDWQQIFKGPPNVSLPIDSRAPTIAGRVVEIRCRPNKVKDDISALHDRVAATNEEYRRRVIPAIEKVVRHMEKREREREQRLAEAQRQLDELKREQRGLEREQRGAR